MKARVLTALALIPPVLAAIFCTSPWPILALLVVIALIGIGEVHRLTGQVLSFLGAILIPAITVFIIRPFSGNEDVMTNPYPSLAFVAGVAFLLGVVSLLAVPANRKKSHPLAPFFAGWLVGPLMALFALHQSSKPGEMWAFASPVLMAIVPLWAGDTAAIFAGKAFGKHKLAPSISPKKTVEGGVANLIFCMLAAWGLGVWLKVPLVQSLSCGFAAGVFGQMGDLFESWLKRRVDLKDSGTLLPGHGGVLDRIDSILFTAPCVAMILLFWPK
jgi:phosphatidate cytidylyltransferase